MGNLLKCDDCLGCRDWLFECRTITARFVHQSCEGRHYFCSMEVHKEVLEELG